MIKKFDFSFLSWYRIGNFRSNTELYFTAEYYFSARAAYRSNLRLTICALRISKDANMSSPGASRVNWLKLRRRNFHLLLPAYPIAEHLVFFFIFIANPSPLFAAAFQINLQPTRNLRSQWHHRHHPLAALIISFFLEPKSNLHSACRIMNAPWSRTKLHTCVGRTGCKVTEQRNCERYY